MFGCVNSINITWGTEFKTHELPISQTFTQDDSSHPAHTPLRKTLTTISFNLVLF